MFLLYRDFGKLQGAAIIFPILRILPTADRRQRLGPPWVRKIRAGEDHMEQLTSTLRENQAALDALLGVGRNYDVISRDGCMSSTATGTTR